MSLVDPSHWIALHLASGLGLKGFWQLLDAFENPAEILKRSVPQLQKVVPLRFSQLAGLADSGQLLAAAEKELRALEELGASVICYPQPQYPAHLRHLVDPPPVLFVIGNSQLLQKRAVAMVGSRAATGYGKRIAGRLARELGQRGLVLVSGLALGIDGAAHAGALQAGGSTVAVLGCGLDQIYPRQNSGLYREIKEKGLLVSEYPLGTLPEGFRFPKRNRIIAGLGQGVVVVEAARKSGSLITAHMALDLGREVFAVPGQIDSAKSEGCHLLLQQGAKLVGSVEDILEELGEDLTFAETGSVQKPQASLDQEARWLLEKLEPYPQSRDELLLKTAMSSPSLSRALLVLELENLVETHPGGGVSRIV